MLDCINEDIIGIAKVVCDCHENPNSIDIETSKSGLYINNLISLQNIEELKDCKNANIFEILQDVRRIGLIRYKQNLERLVSKEFKPSSRTCHHVNRMWKTTTVTSNHSYGWKGLKIQGKNVRGTVMEIEKIVTYFNQTGTKDLYLFSEEDRINPIAIITVTTSGTKVINDVEDLILNLHNNCKTCDEVNYYLMYEVDSITNKDNTCDCGCGGGRCIEQYADLKGVYWNDRNAFENGESPSKTDNYCNGIEIYADFRCDYTVEMCEDSEIDFDRGLGLAHAQGVLYESAKYLLELLAGNSALKNFFDYEKNLLKVFEDRLKENYSYLYDVLKEKKYNCLICKASVRHT